MTNKQQEFLSKFITQSTIDELDSLGYNAISSAIGFIIQTYKNDNVLFKIRVPVNTDIVKRDITRINMKVTPKPKESWSKEEVEALCRKAFTEGWDVGFANIKSSGDYMYHEDKFIKEHIK